MRKKHLIAMLAIAIAMPLAAAHGDTSSTGTDCGSRPTPPATGATQDQITAFRQQMQTYSKCMYPNGRPGGGFGLGGNAGLHNGQGNAALQADKTQLTQDRCNLVVKNITTRVNRYENNQAARVKVMTGLQDRLKMIANKLQNDELDVSQLNTDLDTLNTKINKFATDYGTFIDGLKATQSVQCGTSNGDFATKLGEARSVLPSLRQDITDVRTFVINTIVPDIQKLRQQDPKSDSTSSANTTTDTATTSTNTITSNSNN